jgi:hypothetical protein
MRNAPNIMMSAGNAAPNLNLALSPNGSCLSASPSHKVKGNFHSPKNLLFLGKTCKLN